MTKSANKKIFIIPQSEIDLLDVAKTVQKNWSNDPLVISWINHNQFNDIISDYDNALDSIFQIKSKRIDFTLTLSDLDKKINNSINYVKGYIKEKYGSENFDSHYHRFGIKKIAHYYKIPRDRDERIPALKSLIKSLVDENIQGKYDASYWTPIKDEYIAAYKQTINLDADLAEKVGEKNKLKKEIEKTLRAIIHLVKCNYPDDYKPTLRAWGFQKEKY